MRKKRRSRRAGGGGDDDRLSSLPDELLGHILSFLPTQQAVRARQLSRRWRRVWPAHTRALNLSAVQDCARGARRRSRFGALARGALARLRPARGGIPAISLELDRHADTASAWYREAMERAVGSVRVAVPRGGVSRLDLPRCMRAEALHLRLNHLVDLELPHAPPDAFGWLAELSLSMVMLPAGTPPLHEFLSSSCPRLRMLRLCCVRGDGDAVRRLALRSDALEVLDLNSVDGLEVLDVAAANLRSLSVRSCFRFPPRDGGEETEVAVSAPSMGAVCWYRSYPKRLAFLAGMARVRRLAGLKLPALGRTDQFDFPYTLQLLKACSLVQHLGLDLVVPDQMALLNWLGPGQQGSCEDLLGYVPELPNVSVVSLTLSWGSSGGNIIALSLASFLSRLPNLARLHIDSSPYCFTVLEAQQGAVAPRGQYLRGDKKDDEKTNHLRLDSLREISVDGLKGTDRGECAVLELLLADAQPPPPLLERVSLSFRDVATPVVDEIAGEVRTRFPMAAGRWTRRAPTVLTWTSSS